MKKILVVYANPDYKNSRMNQALLQQIIGNNDVIISNLYEKYPNNVINISEEQRLIQQSDLIVLQFPFYWFNTTPLMKQWIDEVFTFGFAYGDGGDKLRGKDLMVCITIGSDKERYANEKGFTLPELLKPFEYTAKYCEMVYNEPFIVADVNRDDKILHQQAMEYAELLHDCTIDDNENDNQESCS